MVGLATGKEFEVIVIGHEVEVLPLVVATTLYSPPLLTLKIALVPLLETFTNPPPVFNCHW